MGIFSKGPRPNWLFKPVKRAGESEAEYSARLADWKAGKDPLAPLKESYKSASPGEREELHDQLGDVLDLLGMKKESVDKLRRVVEPRPRTGLSDKARQLDNLLHEYENAIAEHPEQARTLKLVYDEAKRKILES
jgi:hypothetical protein